MSLVLLHYTKLRDTREVLEVFVYYVDLRCLTD
jgi:hypothetical protein